MLIASLASVVVTAACLHRTHGFRCSRSVDTHVTFTNSTPWSSETSAEALEALVALWRRQLRRRRLHRGAAPPCCLASSPSSPRPPPPSRRARSGRPTGPRRPRPGSPPVVGCRGRRPSAGCASAGRCATCRRVPEAWREGDIGLDAARAIASARRHRTEAAMARDEEMLVAQASDHGLRGLLPGTVLLEAAGRPRRGRRRGRGRKARRNVFSRPSFAGMWLGPDDARPGLGLHRRRRAQPPGARPLRGRLRRGQGTPRPDRPGSTSWPARSAQRRADALVEMATRSRQRPGRRHPPRPALQRLRRLRDPPRAHL